MESVQEDLVALGRCEKMMKQTTCYSCDKREALTVTMPMEEFDKLEKLALSAHTDKLSVEKLQEQLNTAKKALAEISKMADSGDMTWNSNIKTVINPALAAIGGKELGVDLVKVVEG